MIYGRVIFPDQEKIFIVSFHQVFFPGVFFQQGRIGLQLFQFFLGLCYLLFVVLFALFQFSQLPFFPEMAGNEVPGIKEKDPNREAQCR